MIARGLLLIFIITFTVTIVPPALAYVASSTNYRLQSDSINFAGGRSTSTNFVMEDTVGEVGTGTSTSASYNLHAGYQAMQTGGTLSISAPSDVTLSGTITTGTGGQANGSATWTVITDNSAGYTLAIKASASPAFVSGNNSFFDYTPISGSDPDYTWSVPASAKEFGFTPEGTDIVGKYKDNGLSCNTGSGNTTDACWDDLTTSDQTISQRASVTGGSGISTTVRFRAEAGASSAPATGTYTAAITLTATAL